MRPVFLILIIILFLSACAGQTRTEMVDVRLPQSDWQLIWEDDFSGSVIDPDHWTMDSGNWGWGNEELQNYTTSSENAFLSNGNLVISAQKPSSNSYTSARLKTKGRHAFQYGRIMARIRLPHPAGINAAFWTLGDDIDIFGWPGCGQINIIQTVGLAGLKRRGLQTSAIWLSNDGKQQESSLQLPPDYPLIKDADFFSHYHNYEIIWSDVTMTWLIDNQLVYQIKIDQPDQKELNKPHFLLLSLAVGGKKAGNPAQDLSFPQQMAVDWVRVYQMKTR